MLPGICNQTSRIRKCSEDFGIKGKKGSRLAPLIILTGFFNMRKVERFAQRPNKRFIMADSFARAVRKFRHRFTVTLYQLNHNIQGFYLGISQVRRVPIPKLNCTREEKWRYSSTALRKSRLSEKTSVLLCGINSQLFIMCNGFFTPFNRVARVMTQALIPTSELDTEITQESIHSDAVG